MRKSQRTSKTKLIRSSLSPQKPSTEIKDYELKVNKAIIKKLDHCQINHIETEHKPRNNLTLRFSISAYELPKTSLYELLEQIMEKESIAMVVEKGTYKKNVEVERRYRLVKNGKAGNQVKFIMNCHHTSTSYLINGSRLYLFTKFVLPNIQELLQHNNNLLDNVNSGIQDVSIKVWTLKTTI